MIDRSQNGRVYRKLLIAIFVGKRRVYLIDYEIFVDYKNVQVLYLIFFSHIEQIKPLLYNIYI